MINFLTQNKWYIGGAVIIVGCIFVYFTYFSGGSSAPLSASAPNSPVSTNLLATLQNLNTIKLDNAIFSNPAFVSLTDFGVQIPPENVGRPNPFAPLINTAPSAGSGAVKLPAGLK